MANEVTIFNREINENLHPLFDPIRMIAKQLPIGTGAKTVNIPSAGVLDYDDININASSGYPVAASARGDTEQTFNLTKHEFKPIVISDYDEFVTNYEYRQSVMNDVYGLLGSYAIRSIFGGFWSTANDYDYETTSSTTYTNQFGDEVKGLSLDDISALAMRLDLQKVPRDGQRYLALPPEMYSSALGHLADAGYLDTAAIAFQTGILPNFSGFNIVMLPEVAVASINNGALRTPKTQGTGSTDCSVGFALHKNFVGFAESGVRVFIDEKSAGYYGTVISGSLYAGGKYLRANPIGCISVYEKAN